MKKHAKTPALGVDEGNLHLENPLFAQDTPDEVTRALFKLAESSGYSPEERSKNPRGPRTDYEILSKYVCSLQQLIEEFEKPLEFEYKEGRPMIIFKIGSEDRGWVPNDTHFAKARKMLKASGMDKKFNILLYHFGIHTEYVGK